MEKETKPKGPNGGKRPGAGRKPDPELKKQKLAYKRWLLTPEALELQKLLYQETKRFHNIVQRISSEFGVKVVEQVNFSVVFDHDDPGAAKRNREQMERIRRGIPEPGHEKEEDEVVL